MRQHARRPTTLTGIFHPGKAIHPAALLILLAPDLLIHTAISHRMIHSDEVDDRKTLIAT